MKLARISLRTTPETGKTFDVTPPLAVLVPSPGKGPPVSAGSAMQVDVPPLDVELVEEVVLLVEDVVVDPPVLDVVEDVDELDAVPPPLDAPSLPQLAKKPTVPAEANSASARRRPITFRSIVSRSHARPRS
jgi:hypothetical protein